MTSKNDVTGDSIQTKIPSDSYRNNYDAIFRKKNKEDLPVAWTGREEKDQSDFPVEKKD